MNCNLTVLVPVYNEAANIGRLLDSISRRYPVVVVASGCTDGTEAIVKKYPVRLLIQKKRQGKTAAINYFLKRDRSPLVALVGGDVILAPGCLEKMARHFLDPAVGMVGARIVPVNRPDRFLGWTNRLIWQLHARVARVYPRLGEVTLWRREFDCLPSGTICDEAEIEMMLKSRGRRLIFEPKAVAYNRGPEKFWEYFNHRRGIRFGHRLIKRRWGKTVVSADWRLVGGYFWRQFRQDKRRIFWYAGVLIIEVLAAVFAGGKPIWPQAKTSKCLNI